jgi:hypothetical protein
MKSNRKRQIHPAVGAISARGVRGRGVEGEGSLLLLRLNFVDDVTSWAKI